MYAVAFGIFRNADDASDAVQETMSGLWSRHITLPVPDSPGAFCTSSLRHTCIDMLRKRRFDSLEGVEAIAAQSADAPASFHSSLGFIRSLLDDFPPKQRKILTLSFISQLSNDEIVAATGESAANVRQIISRGRQKLKILISHETR